MVRLVSECWRLRTVRPIIILLAGFSSLCSVVPLWLVHRLPARGRIMSRRPAWLLSLFGFGLGVLVILSSGGGRYASGQPKPLVVPPSPQAPTLTTPASLG